MFKEASPILISLKCHHHPQANLNYCPILLSQARPHTGGKNWFEKINMLHKPNKGKSVTGLSLLERVPEQIGPV